SSAMRPDRWAYVEDKSSAKESIRGAGTRYTFSGHVHDQRLYSLSAVDKMTGFRPVPGVAVPVAAHRAWLALVGAVGQQRDGNRAAGYAIFDPDMRSLSYFRVPYDADATARKIRAAGLPDALAARIERGS